MMRRVLYEIADQCGRPAKELDALEVFAGTGKHQLRFWAPRVKSVEAWEIRPERIAELGKNVPNATIKQVDSYEEIQRTANTFDLVSVDGNVHSTGHTAFLDMLPLVYRVLRDDAFLVVTIFTNLPGYLVKRKTKAELRREIEEEYGRFFESDDLIDMPFDHINQKLKEHAYRCDFHTLWTTILKRSDFVAYYAAHLKKMAR